MDPGSGGNRSKMTRRRKSDNVDNAKKSVEEVPKILSPELQDIFPIFASMLDIRSFAKLAMASKEMNRRCMENKSIIITLDKVKLDASSKRLNFYFEVEINKPFVLQKLPCKVNVRTLEILNSPQPQFSVGSMVYRMKKYGINEIHELNVARTMDEEAITTVFKEFAVKSVNIDRSIAVEALRSLLQLNMEKFSYHDQVDIDFILEIESPIREIYFLRVRNTVSKDKFANLLSKIQSGSFHKLTINNTVIDWNDFKKLPLNHKGALPDERPLVLTRTPRSGPCEYWVLHSDGGITKCVISGTRPTKLQISKWEEKELPGERNEEEVMKDLMEKRSNVSCSAEHFHTFCAGFTMLEASHEGPLPEVRPLYCKVSENRFWMLDEDEKLMKCNWKDDEATWTPFDPYMRNQNDMGHPALAKHMFWKLLKQVDGSDECFLYFKENPKLLGECETLEMDYSGDLPNTRPLIFARSAHALCCTILSIILLEDDRLIECRICHGRSVRFKLCHYSNRPAVLYTAENVVEALKKPDNENSNFNIRFEIFRDGLEQLKKSLLALQKRLLVLETTKSEIWYILDGVARKVVWKKGRLSISEEVDLLACPSSLLFRYFAENPEKCDSSFELELEEFRNCLKQFTVVPFDYTGPLMNDSPQVFVKDDIRHTCRKGLTRRPRCNCVVHSMAVWFLWNGTRLTKCSWGKEEPKKILFRDSSIDDLEVPAILKSKEHLKNLLEAKYNESSQFQWFGSVDDFLANLSDYVKLPFDHDGPLPSERPLLFEDSSNKENPICFNLRKDGTVVKCEWQQSDSVLSMCSASYDEVPSALKSVL